MEGISFRKFRDTDAKQLVAVANNKKIWQNVRDNFPHPYTLKDSKAFIARAAKGEGECIFAIALDDVCIGGCGAVFGKDIYAKNAELGYWIGENYWNRGVGTQAVQWLTDHLFSGYPLNRLYAGVFEYNIASANVLEKCGYRFEARIRQALFKENRYYDELLYSLLREQWQEKD